MRPKRSKAKKKTEPGSAAPAPAPAPAPARSPAPASPPLLGPGFLQAPEAPAPRSWRLRLLVVLAILVPWGLGFGVRALWLAEAEEAPQSSFEEHRLLTTADAYFYASGVKREITGTLSANPRVPTSSDSIVVAIAAGAVSLFGLPIEAVCTWMPAVLAPLIGLPLVLLGLLFGRLAWGFLAGLIAAVGFSYWNRTLPGYFDTDMVNITYLLGVGLLLMAAFWRQRAWLGSIAALLTVIAPYVHPGSERVLAACTLGALAYTLVFARRDARAYRVVLALLIAFLPLPMWARMTLIAALELAFMRLRVPLWAVVSAAFATLVLVALTSQAMDLVLDVLGIGKGAKAPIVAEVQFRGLGETVAELANPSVSKLAERISGNVALLLSGVAGYLLASWRYRPLLLLAPLLFLGTVHAAGGQRYTIFAVPVVALGNAWLALLVGQLVARARPQHARFIAPAVASLLSAGAVAIAVAQALALPPRTALTTGEAQVLSELGKRVAPGDFLVSWWDYAYGAWYYAGASTIVDGTKQNQDVWIASELLFTSSQREAAGLARLAAEKQATQPPLEPVIDDLLADWKAQSGRPVSDFVPALREGRVPLPAPTRQVYVYLPWRIVSIAPNIATTRPAKGLVPDGELGQGNFLMLSQKGTRGGWSYDAADQLLVGPRGERVSLYEVADVTSRNGRVHASTTRVREDGKGCVVNLAHIGATLFMDRAVYESVLAQLLFLARPDPRYFEPVINTRGGAVYRVVP